MIFPRLTKTIEILDISNIPGEREQILQPLIEYIQQKVNSDEAVNLNLICTHNSRRSHFSQVWSQTMAFYFKVKDVHSYSGGTEATALFPTVAKTLIKNGFQIKTISEGNNPVYSIKFSDNEHPIIGFSKKFNDDFNPKSNFAAIMTCSHADENCPVVLGCDVRIPVTYEDPKAFDNTPQQEEKYLERSLQIATEMKYIFSKINA